MNKVIIDGQTEEENKAAEDKRKNELSIRKLREFDRLLREAPK